MLARSVRVAADHFAAVPCRELLVTIDKGPEAEIMSEFLHSSESGFLPEFPGLIGSAEVPAWKTRLADLRWARARL